MDFAAGNLFVTGELGAGKTMYAVRLIQEYLREGRPVATNLNLRLDVLCGPSSKATAIRIPDKPTAEHLRALGPAYDVSAGYDEKKFGLLVLDECLTWLNSRAWQDKERAGVLDWFLHARKLGWNVCFLLQKADYCDPQIRDTLLTYHVNCVKMGKFNVPFFGKLMGLKMPKGTWATVSAGFGPAAIPQNREFYKGKDYYQAYDTAQVFSSGFEWLGDGMVDMRASYTMLSGWTTVGRYLVQERKKKRVKWSWVIGYYVVRPPVWLLLKPIEKFI